jgi:hypothetical protein
MGDRYGRIESMSRTADYTIQGFLYQFNKTLLEVLKAPEYAAVTVEGIVEDIDISSPSGTKAIQCKYHETQQTFALNKVYKPLLQMMVHFQRNSNANIVYVLYCYFPEKTAGEKYNLTRENIQQILSSKKKEFAKHIDALQTGFDDVKFLSVLSVEFGKPMDMLVSDVQDELVTAGIPRDDVELIAYPNAINDIATVACKHTAAERILYKADLVARLERIRTTAISRWTLALKTRSKLLALRKRQLKDHLDINARERHFIISHGSLDDFESGVVLFISDYLSKYHHKPAHIRTPLFCLDCKNEVFSSIRLRLHNKGIIVEDGMIGDYFDEKRFLREPMSRKRSRREIEREFNIRLLRYGSPLGILERHKGDDLFIIGNEDYGDINTQDLCVERLAVTNLKEACYLIGVSHECE